MNDFGFYFKMGWDHIISPEALDHILFIAALAALYMLKDWRQVLILVTAFTIGHALTLALSTLQVIEVSSRWVEFLIPCTIIFTALSNVFVKSFTQRAIRVNYFLALFFGLIHGLAFANILRVVLAQDQSFPLAMFSFSLGLEVGQILIVLLVLLLAQLLVASIKLERRLWVFLLSGVVFCLAASMIWDRLPWQNEHAASGNAAQMVPVISIILNA